MPWCDKSRFPIGQCLSSSNCLKCRTQGEHNRSQIIGRNSRVHAETDLRPFIYRLAWSFQKITLFFNQICWTLVLREQKEHFGVLWRFLGNGETINDRFGSLRSQKRCLVGSRSTCTPCRMNSRCRVACVEKKRKFCSLTVYPGIILFGRSRLACHRSE